MHQRVSLSSPMSSVFWAFDFANPVSVFGTAGSFSTPDYSGLCDSRITWGRSCKDSTVCEATEGSGSLSVCRGAEIIRRVIRFHSNQESPFLPTDRKSIGRVFRTAFYADGTAVDIVTPRPIPVLDSNAPIDVSYDCRVIATTVVDDAYPELDPVEVVLETGPFRSTFTRDEISALDKVYCFDHADTGSLT